MFNVTAKYVKVWKVDVKEKMVLVDLSVSKKNQDGTYSKSSYKNVKFVGKQLEEAKTMQKGDTIHISNGMIGKREYNGSWYDDVIVFGWELVEKAKEKPAETSYNTDDFASMEDTDDVPF